MDDLIDALDTLITDKQKLCHMIDTLEGRDLVYFMLMLFEKREISGDALTQFIVDELGGEPDCDEKLRTFIKENGEALND